MSEGYGSLRQEIGNAAHSVSCQTNLLVFSISHGSFIFFNKIGNSLRSIASVLNIFVLKVIIYP